MPLFYTEKKFLKALHRGDEETVAAYLKKDAAYWTTKAFENGETALFGCINSLNTNPLKITRLLLAAGADPNARDDAGNTPLMSCAGRYYMPTDMCALLVEYGADPNARNKYGHSALIRALDWCDDNPIVDALLKAGADPNETGKPLILAVKHGNASNIKALIAAGADVRQTDGKSHVMHLAARHAGRASVKALAAAGADVNIRDGQGNTPLHIAAKRNHGKVIRALIKAGAQPNTLNASGQTPLAIAQRKGRKQKNCAAEILEPLTTAKSIPARPKTGRKKGKEQEGNAWMKLDEARIAYIATYRALKKQVTEVFNFAARERITLTKDLETGKEAISRPEGFDNVPEPQLRDAFQRFLKKGGQAEPEHVFAQTTANVAPAP